MEEQRWSAGALRDFVRRLDTEWRTEEDVQASERASFRAHVTRNLAPEVQTRILESVGVVVDATGVGYLADSLLDEPGVDDERRWLMVAPDPWAYLGDWLAAVVTRSYRRAAGTPRSNAKELKRLAEALRPDGPRPEGRGVDGRADSEPADRPRGT